MSGVITQQEKTVKRGVAVTQIKKEKVDAQDELNEMRSERLAKQTTHSCDRNNANIISGTIIYTHNIIVVVYSAII